MDKRPVMNKGQRATAETCPYCSREISDYGCRVTPTGFWCLMAGLQEDPRRIITPAPDPLRQIIEETREVKAAAAELERLTRAAEEATSAWERAALAEYQAKARRHDANSRTTVVVDGYARSIPAPGTSDHELQQLADVSAELDGARRRAENQKIKARQALDQTRASARHRLTQVAA